MLHVRNKSLGLVMLLTSLWSSLSADFYVIPVKSKGLNTIKVAKSGEKFSDPVTALASILDASPNNPYRVVIEEGIYTLSIPLNMKAYVDIVGVGDVVLKGAFGTSSIYASAVVYGETNASIHNVSIVNEGNSATGYSIAMLNNATSPYVSGVTLSGIGGQWNIGMTNRNGAAPMLMDVDINASAGDQSIGMTNYASSPIMHRGAIVVADSSVNANYGIYNQSGASPVISNVTIDVSGGSWSYGVRNDNNSSPSLHQVNISVTSQYSNYGVYNHIGSSPALNGVVISAGSGIDTSAGVYSYDNSYPVIVGSQITGVEFSLDTLTNASALVSHSTLVGSVSATGGASNICEDVQNGEATILNGDCTLP